MTTQQSSFLPEDYVEQRAERRMIVIGLFLFIVIMSAVVAAFFVTNQQWSTVRQQQRRINEEYASAAEQIEELTALEMQKSQLDEKAEITAALIEPVPRSILLAELINRMPNAVSLEEFGLTSEHLKEPAKAADNKSQIRSLSSKRTDDQQPTKAQEAEKREIQVPRYKVTVYLIGVAPTDVHVSEYISRLNKSPMLKSVELKYSQETKVDSEMLRQFRIESTLDPEADVKSIEPMREPRIDRNPMGDTMEIDRFDQDMVDVTLDRKQNGRK